MVDLGISRLPVMPTHALNDEGQVIGHLGTSSIATPVMWTVHDDSARSPGDR